VGEGDFESPNRGARGRKRNWAKKSEGDCGGKEKGSLSSRRQRRNGGLPNKTREGKKGTSKNEGTKEAIDGLWRALGRKLEK